MRTKQAEKGRKSILGRRERGVYAAPMLCGSLSEATKNLQLKPAVFPAAKSEKRVGPNTSAKK